MKTLAAVFFALTHSFLFSQTSVNTITLLNPSFEGTPRAGKTPTAWSDCGFPGETPPDIQPGEFGVSKAAYDGETYLGMVVRDNDTWERVGQELSSPIHANQCYQFSIYLQRSNIYLSASRVTEQMVQYTTPVKLKIWGGNDRCMKAELLAETAAIKDDHWESYTLTINGSAPYQYILFEAFYLEPVLYPYNGNILLDHVSDIVPISCDAVPKFRQTEIMYYTSVLTPIEEEAFFQKIDDYLVTSAYAAMIYVTEKSRKQAEESKKHLVEKLTAMGWTLKDFTIDIAIK